VTIAAGATSATIDTVRALIPSGKTLVTRSVYLTSPCVVLRSGSIFWNLGNTSDAGGETLNLETEVIATNGSASPGYYTLALILQNPTGATIVVPAGHKTMINYAFF
jgi:hypothetical protein